jgi:hypothetical protein
MSSIYQPLPEGNIRLLQLHPRQDDSLVSCSFSIHDISDEALTPTYVALSYAWGRDDPTHRILIDDETIMVRQNLYEFLLECRHCDAIWIDALCINQQDNAERSLQVQMMGRIYSSAQVVWAWLGPAHDPEVNNTLVSLRDNASTRFSSDLKIRKNLYSIGSISRHDY